MRTTLDLDDVVLSVARTKARAEGVSVGRAVSELALYGLECDVRSVHAGASGFPVLAGDPAHRVTDELVASYRDDD